MSAGSTESEIKTILDAGEGERLQDRLGEPVRTLRQVNHYYETPEDHLARAKVSLRVREEEEVGGDGRKLLLTVKEAGLRAGALIVRPEIESEMDEGAWGAIRGGRMHFAEVDLPPIRRLQEAVDGFADLPLAELGRLENVREVFEFTSESLAMQVLLDRTTYPDGSQEVELECELHQADAGQGARALRGLFDELGIDWRPSEVGKYVRLRRKIGREMDDA